MNKIIERIVDRFLSWKLPEDFNPDAGISFKAEFNEHTDFPMKHDPVGTNLLDHEQATEMVKHILGDEIQSLEAKVKKYEEALGFYANEENWITNIYQNKVTPMLRDYGKRAREVLGENE